MGGCAALTWGAESSQGPCPLQGEGPSSLWGWGGEGEARGKREVRVWSLEEEAGSEWRAGRRLLGKLRLGEKKESIPGDIASEGRGGTRRWATATSQSLVCLLHGQRDPVVPRVRPGVQQSL